MSKKKNKNNYRNNVNNDTGLDSDITQTIIYSIVIVAIIAVFFTLMLNRNNSYQPVNTNSNDVWEQEFNRVANNRVGVVFDAVSTTDKEYDQLRVACNDYIEDENNSDAEDVSIDVGVDVNISENTFVDMNNTSSYKLDIFDLPKALNSESNINKDVGYMVETGPIYFNDLLMLRYINSYGDLKVIASKFHGESDIDILTQNDIIYGVVDEGVAGISGDIKQNSSISEKDYIITVAKCIRDILIANNSDDEKSAISKSLAYFTIDGKDAILKCRNTLNIDKKANVDLIFGAAGKSDTSEVVKDRVYLRFKVSKDNEEEYINMIVKLNNYLRIFDIDIL